MQGAAKAVLPLLAMPVCRRLGQWDRQPRQAWLHGSGCRGAYWPASCSSSGGCCWIGLVAQARQGWKAMGPRDCSVGSMSCESSYGKCCAGGPLSKVWLRVFEWLLGSQMEELQGGKPRLATLPSGRERTVM